MTVPRFIVHRGNSPENTQTPIEQVEYYVELGYTKIEIDIYALTENTFKFCHPLYKDRVDKTHNLNDGFIGNVVNSYPIVEWFVDLKCLDLDAIPKAMIDYLIESFGKKAVFISAQKEILEYIHRKNMRTGQYFRVGETINLNYEPDFYLRNVTETLLYPKNKTIICGANLETATTYRTDGYAEIMVDGKLLIV